MKPMDHVESARANFRRGYNCAQAVAVAFCDLTGLGEEESARLACSFGGGMGRLREVCGTYSAMLLVLGLVEGYDEPKAFEKKKELYRQVQELAATFRDENGSIICREPLGLGAGPSDPTPEQRTDSYYRKRPCPELCASAARILAGHLETLH